MEGCEACAESKIAYAELLERNKGQKRGDMQMRHVNCTQDMTVCQFFGVQQLPRFLVLAKNRVGDDTIYHYPAFLTRTY